MKDPRLSEVTDKDVLAYVEAENAYFEAVMAPRQPLIDRLYEEMKGRIKEDESSVPQKDGDWIYWTGFETGGQYRKWWRKPVAGGPDELLLDEPALAEGKEYFRLGPSRSATMAVTWPMRSTTMARNGSRCGSRI